MTIKSGLNGLRPCYFLKCHLDTDARSGCGRLFYWRMVFNRQDISWFFQKKSKNIQTFRILNRFIGGR